MSLNQRELMRLTAGDIRFDSYQGSIEVYGLSHPFEHMPDVKGSVNLTAEAPGSNITFSTEASQFRQLYAIASNGFDIHKDVNTSDGVAFFNWTRENMHLHALVNVIATNGDLVLTSRNGSITAQTPASLQSVTHNILPKKTNLIILEHIGLSPPWNSHFHENFFKD